MTDPRAVVSWLNDLATLTAGNAPLADSRAKVAALTGMLATDYPPEAFSRASLRHVARECKFFPSYAELVAILDAYRRANDALLIPHEPPPRESTEPYNPVACTKPQETIPAFRPHLPMRSPWEQMAELGLTQEQIAALFAARKPDPEKLKEVPLQQAEPGADIASVVPITAARADKPAA